MSLTTDTLLPVAAAITFAGFAAATLGGALVAVASRQLVRNVGGLALSFMGLAGLYYFLGSPFLALMQILIYVGVVCITILFALMLTEAGETRAYVRRRLWVDGGLLLVAGLLGGGLLLLVRRSAWMPTISPNSPGALPDLGRALLTRFGFAFEAISVVLLIAILGAVVVARSGRRPPS